MWLKKTIFVLLVLTADSCNRETWPKFAPCNILFTACSSGENGQYCTFGYKFGEHNPFSPAGMETPAPPSGTTTISFSFMEGGNSFSTSSEDGLISRSFSDAEKSTIREIFAEWEAVADITFIESNGADRTDITVILAEFDKYGGIGYPPLTDAPCSQISGYLILNSKTSSRRSITIHELGHVLGLGHVVSNNVMNPNHLYEHLQPGDIEGVQSIYGVK